MKSHKANEFYVKKSRGYYMVIDGYDMSMASLETTEEAANKTAKELNEMRAKTEYLKRIDEFLTMFGYKTNSLKMPKITGRKNWNYVEISANSDIGFGTVPSIYMETINNACRRGVTIWHNHTNLGDYSQDNSIV